MVPTSVKKGRQRQMPAPGIAPSLIESVTDVHESFEDMLSDFRKLQIESPEPVIEHQTSRHYSSGWRFADESCTTYQIGRDVVPWWEVDEEVRRAEPATGHVTNRESDIAAFENPVEVKDHDTGRLLVAEAFPGLEESFVLVDEASQSTTFSEWEAISPFSEESEVTYPQGPLYSETQLQNRESVLDLGAFEEVLPCEPPAFVPGPSRELITKPDGSRFVATGMHHLTAYKPNDLRHIVDLPFGSFDIKNLKTIILGKLTKKVPLDCITFTGHEQYSVLAERNTCLPWHRKSLKVSQWHVRTKMTPEDWHHVLTVCGDEDWQDFDKLWQDFLPTVTSDFLCSICDAELPRPRHRRIWQLRGES
ncbi:hypothetical protein DL98DRAFT_618040 [Cadophora sp. DSE1049]|nr:hypothetical protein DL98DRAFT_618040 [Cadophora sp. DSE1049]